MTARGFRPIEEHAVIGDQRTVALVATDGTIDFLCWPRFDAPTVFASLLDAERGGEWRLAAHLDRPQHRQIYIPDTNLLLTRSFSHAGVGEVLDFMPVEAAGKGRAVLRRARAVRGELDFVMTVAPRFGYATVGHRAHRAGDGTVVFEPDDGPALRLRADVPVEVRHGDVHARFRLRSGQAACFVLEPADGDGGGSPWVRPEAFDDAFHQVAHFWRRWIRRSTYRGRWQDPVHRSALTIKLLQSADHGAMIAAPTFGLPEWVGGVRNWDYRYVWIRDAAFALHALAQLGIVDEGEQFIRWLTDVCLAARSPDQPPIRVLYRVDGGADTDERVLAGLSGHQGSRPVRIGNAAGDQLQLDIYGELIDTMFIFEKHREPVHLDTWALLARVTDWIATHWRQPDEGIWEPRAVRREYLHSRVQCWVALDRAMRIAERDSLPAPMAAWRSARDEIHRDVLARFWDPELPAFVQYPGARIVDASSLLLPLVRFISPTDRRWCAHLRTLERTLVEDATVYRYPPGRGADGLPGQEGTFSVCGFWLVECLARSGAVERAQLLFEKMLGYANHVGLYAEQLGQRLEHLGNFPQLLTHLGVISAAITLDRALAGSGE